MKTVKFSLLSLFLLACLCAVGCSGSYKVCQLEGTLTFNGTPVPETDIAFLSDNNDRPAIAHTDAQGHFRARYTKKVDGIPPGTYKVVLSIEPSYSNDDTKKRDEIPDFKKLLDKYSTKEKSDVTVDATKPNKDYKLEVTL